MGWAFVVLSTANCTSLAPGLPGLMTVPLVEEDELLDEELVLVLDEELVLVLVLDEELVLPLDEELVLAPEEVEVELDVLDEVPSPEELVLDVLDEDEPPVP